MPSSVGDLSTSKTSLVIGDSNQVTPNVYVNNNSKIKAYLNAKLRGNSSDSNIYRERPKTSNNESSYGRFTREN